MLAEAEKGRIKYRRERIVKCEFNATQLICCWLLGPSLSILKQQRKEKWRGRGLGMNRKQIAQCNHNKIVWIPSQRCRFHKCLGKQNFVQGF